MSDRRVETVFGKKFSEISESYHQFATMNESGLSTIETLDYFKTLPNPADRKKATLMDSMVRRGKTLSQAAMRVGLPPFDVQILKAGEETGKLQVFIKILSEYYRYRGEVFDAIRGAMVEPGITLMISLVVLPLPNLVTGTMTIYEYAFDILGILAGFYILGMLLYRAYLRSLETKELSRIRFKIVQWIPFAGSMSKMMALETFTYCLQGYIEAGYGLNQALQAASEVTYDEKLENLVKQKTESIRPNQTMSSVLSALGRFSPDQIRIIETGELTGTLDRSLAAICKQCREQAIQSLNRFKMFFQKACKGVVTVYVAYKIIHDFTLLLAVLDKIQ